MKTHAFPLDFIVQGPSAIPVDRELFKMAEEYCKKNVNNEVNLSKFNKVWVICRVDKDGKPVKVTGIGGFVYRIDIPLFCTKEAAAAKVLIDRVNNYLADNGAREAEAFIHISENEPEETRCPQWQRWLKAVGAKPAERYAVKVR